MLYDVEKDWNMILHFQIQVMEQNSILYSTHVQAHNWYEFQYPQSRNILVVRFEALEWIKQLLRRKAELKSNTKN